MRKWILLLPLSLLLGCASAPPVFTAPPPQPAYAEQPAWHSCRAQLAWQQGEEPDFGLDVMLAFAVFGPALDQQAGPTVLWRFHRRAARDGAGHRFSLIFRADGATAGRLRQALFDNPYLQWALHDGLVEELDCADGGAWIGAAVSASSDPAWGDSLQRAWPYFIQGSSRLWLELIRAEMPALAPEASLAELHEASREAERRVNAIWLHQGRHALLHHLNAIFGYHPLLMRY